MNENVSKEGGMSDDMRIVLSLVGHIRGPCEDEQGNNVRDVYTREARKLLETIQDKKAKDILEAVLQEYS